MAVCTGRKVPKRLCRAWIQPNSFSSRWPTVSACRTRPFGWIRAHDPSATIWKPSSVDHRFHLLISSSNYFLL